MISQQVTDVQGFIESSKFETGAGAADAQAVQQLTGDAQMVFLVLLSIARHAESAPMRMDAVRAATIRVGADAAALLERLAESVQYGGARTRVQGDDVLTAFQQSIAAQAAAVGEDTTSPGAVALYRQLAISVSRVASSDVPSISATAR